MSPAKVGQPIALASYNLDNGRPPTQVANEVKEIKREFGSGVIFMQEGAGYWKAFRKNVKGYRTLLPKRRGRPARDTFLLASKGLRAKHVKAHPMKQGWERAPGRPGLHPARVLNIYRVDWIDKVAAVHLPPTPVSEKRPNIGKSYPLRSRAWNEYMKHLGGLVDEWNEKGLDWVAGGDWNIAAGDKRMQAWAEKHDATIKGGGIDFFILGSTVAGDNWRKPDFGKGDHGHIALLDVRPKRKK